MPKTIKSCILDMLEDLRETQLRKFRTQLLDRREEPRVRRNAVENKDIFDISDVLVSTFTEAGALTVTLEILREIDFSEEADRLAKATSGLSSTAGSSTASGSSAGASGGGTMSGGKHFVDKHREELINRVSMVSPILDKLLAEDVISPECYDNIRSKSTTQEQMRELYKSLKASGDRGKDILYDILAKQKYLMEDLNKNGAMATSKELLLETLEHLGDEELKRFKWFLHQADILQGFPPIPRSRLERADRLDTVDQMVQIYSQHTPEVTMKVLMKMNRNDLVQLLPNISSGPKDEVVTVLFSKADILEPVVPKSRLETADRQDTVDLTAHIYSEHSPHVNMKVLIKISRNDLQLLSNTSSGPKASGSSAAASGVGTTVGEKHFVDKHRSALIQRVNKVALILDELLDNDVIDQECYDNIMSKPTTQDKMRELYKSLKACGDRGKDIFYDILKQQEKFLMADLKKNE
ncbi:uncharacterized protein LOC139917902 [Centroberyx gerrardi]